jgi:hypothetical protein
MRLDHFDFNLTAQRPAFDPPTVAELLAGDGVFEAMAHVLIERSQMEGNRHRSFFNVEGIGALAASPISSPSAPDGRGRLMTHFSAFRSVKDYSREL